MARKKRPTKGSSELWGWLRLGGYALVKAIFWMMGEGG